jgi:hypothetical protein
MKRWKKLLKQFRKTIAPKSPDKLLDKIADSAYLSHMDKADLSVRVIRASIEYGYWRYRIMASVIIALVVLIFGWIILHGGGILLTP